MVTPNWVTPGNVDALTRVDSGSSTQDFLNGGIAAWSTCPLGSAPARLLRLPRARLAALGS